MVIKTEFFLKKSSILNVQICGRLFIITMNIVIENYIRNNSTSLINKYTTFFFKLSEACLSNIGLINIG